MTYGLPWSEQFVCQLSKKGVRDEFVADQVRTRIALMVKMLREQDGRGWSQTELGQKMGKPQNVVSRIEDPDYGRMSLTTLLEVVAAFDLPLWIDIPDWGEWLRKTKCVPSNSFCRKAFDLDELRDFARAAKDDNFYNVKKIRFDEPTKATPISRRDNERQSYQLTAL